MPLVTHNVHGSPVGVTLVTHNVHVSPVGVTLVIYNVHHTHMGVLVGVPVGVHCLCLGAGGLGVQGGHCGHRQGGS